MFQPAVGCFCVALQEGAVARHPSPGFCFDKAWEAGRELLLKREREWRECSGLFRPEEQDIWECFPGEGGMGAFVNLTPPEAILSESS